MALYLVKVFCRHRGQAELPIRVDDPPQGRGSGRFCFHLWCLLKAKELFLLGFFAVPPFRVAGMLGTFCFFDDLPGKDGKDGSFTSSPSGLSRVNRRSRIRPASGSGLVLNTSRTGSGRTARRRA